MTRPSRLPWQRDRIIETVWPYLRRMSEDLTARLEAGTGTAGPSDGAAAATTRTTVQINFSASDASGDGYVGPLDTGGALLLDAILLYRAQGGEILRRFTLSQPAPLTDEWEVEIVYSTFNRSSPAGFSVPISLTVDEVDNFAQVSPNQPLSEGQCLFAFIPSTILPEPGGRVDGTLEIERDATLA